MMRLGAGLIGVAFLSGCASTVTPYGPGNVVQPEPEETRLWQASEGEVQVLASEGMRYRDERLQAYIDSVLERILSDNRRAYLPLEPEIWIVDVPLVNAACYPSADILINTAILGRMRNEAELAMLLGHELTHATHRHTHRRFAKAYAASGAISYAAVLSAIVSGDLSRGVSVVGGLITQSAIEGYGRDLERESDRVGLTLAAQAGYDPHRAAVLFERMLAASTKPGSGKSTLLFYASHPKMTERVASASALAAQLDPQLLAEATDVGEERYAAACKELIFDEAERYVALGRYDLVAEAVDYLQRHVPDDPRAAVLRGDVARHQGELADARIAYQRAISAGAASPGAHRGLGLVAAKEGDEAEARQHLQRYLQLAPDAHDRAFIEGFLRNLAAE